MHSKQLKQGKNRDSTIIKEILQMRPLQLFAWFFLLYGVGIFVVNPFVAFYYDLGIVGIVTLYSYSKLAIISHGCVLLIVAAVALITALLYQPPQSGSKPQPIISKPTPPKLPVAPTPNGPRDITNGVQKSFLVSGAVAEDITVGGKSSKLYKLSDLIFDLNTTAHFLITGQTGSGKSTTAMGILTLCNRLLRYPPTIILDAGKQDFDNALAYETDDILAALDMVYWIIKGRQKEPIGTKFKPLLVVLEEAETLFRTINTTLTKKQLAATNLKLAHMLLTARKLNVNFVFIAQTAKSTDLDTSLRNQFGNRIFMRLSNTASRMYNVPFDISSLPSGVGFYEQADSFIAFPSTKGVPPMNALTWQQLEAMANRAQSKHKIGPDYEELEREQVA